VKALCAAHEYPTDVGAFFAESYCLAHVLVERKDRQTLLSFVKDGTESSWEAAAKTRYGLTLDEIEQVMLDQAKVERRAADKAVVERRVKEIPTFAFATADSVGRISVINHTDSYYEPVTTYIRHDVPVKGSATPKTYVQPVTNYRLRDATETRKTFTSGTVKAATPQGKPVEEAKLLDALKGKTVAVVLVTDPDHFDKRFADLLKPDTIILIVPAEKTPMPPPPAGMPDGR
jgi:hypothetical protein